MTSKKTTIAGALAAIVAIMNIVIAVIDGDPSTVPDFASAGAALLAALGLLFARDNDKSSEDVGVK